MTQQELRQFSFQLINTLIEKGCYIKGYGKLFRVCDKEHRPEINITRQQMDVLTHNNIVAKKDLIWTVCIIANPFTTGSQVKLPSKLYAE